MSTPASVTVFLDGVGLVGPGLTDWQSAIPILRDPSNLALLPLVVPVPEFLPAAERRRVGSQVKLALAVGREATGHARQDAATLANVFSASQGDGDNCHAICEVLASKDRQISPTRFHNSVHNAPAGYWGIAMRCMAASTSLCAFDGSFAAGLLEAAVQSVSGGGPTLLVASDTPYPEPLNTVRPMPFGFAIGLVVNPRRSANSLAQLTLSISTQAPDRMASTLLEQIRLSCPAARSLPLLNELASATSAKRTLQLDYLGNDSLQVVVEKLLA